MSNVIWISEFKARRRLRLAAADERAAQLAARKAARSGHVSDAVPADWVRFGLSPALLTDPDEAA